MQIVYVLLIVVWVCFPASIHAELYRYTDQNGVLRFTDNLADVPENQRIKVFNYTEAVDTPRPEEQTQDSVEDQTTQSIPADTDKRYQTEINKAQDRPLSERLIKIKAELDKEYAELMKQWEAFIKQRKILSTETKSRGYKDNAVRFNERLADFEKRRRLFQEKVDAYNAEASE